MEATDESVSEPSPSNGALPISDPIASTDLSHRVAVEAGIREEQAETAVRVVQQQSLHIGPHPSAEEIARFNELEPGLGNRLIETFIAQQMHTMQLNARIVSIAEQDAKREDGWLRYVRGGQRIGFVMAVLFLVSALLTAFFLHEYWLAAAFIAAPTIGVVAQFIRGASR